MDYGFHSLHGGEKKRGSAISLSQRGQRKGKGAPSHFVLGKGRIECFKFQYSRGEKRKASRGRVGGGRGKSFTSDTNSVTFFAEAKKKKKKKATAQEPVQARDDSRRGQSPFKKKKKSRSK